MRYLTLFEQSLLSSSYHTSTNALSDSIQTIGSCTKNLEAILVLFCFMTQIESHRPRDIANIFCNYVTPILRSLLRLQSTAPVSLQTTDMASSEPSSFMHRQQISELNDELRGMICSVRDLEDCIEEENLSGTDVKSAFAEIFLPRVLFSPAIQHYLRFTLLFETG